MKYYTKELYNEMQIYGFLVFPESKEQWEELVQSYYDMDINYIERLQKELAYRKNDLLKFLPASLHSEIRNGTFMTEYPSQDQKDIIEHWRSHFEHKLETIRKECKENYGLIKHVLPVNAVRLYEEVYTHDATVLAVDFSQERQECILLLNTIDGNGQTVDIQLTFSRVHKVANIEHIMDAWWIYNEVYATDNGFELHVLYQGPFEMMETSIEAKDVFIEYLPSSIDKNK
ncbi:DUF4085 family protein [Lysinibacillus sp. NPDC097195]|uniref:DUF4085 family protein n=1 Tax=Lysinibacillus sp. NPDC097195 TaxID=3364141 RepID=UPI003817215C